MSKSDNYAHVKIKEIRKRKKKNKLARKRSFCTFSSGILSSGSHIYTMAFFSYISSFCLLIHYLLPLSTFYLHAATRGNNQTLYLEQHSNTISFVNILLCWPFFFFSKYIITVRQSQFLRNLGKCHCQKIRPPVIFFSMCVHLCIGLLNNFFLPKFLFLYVYIKINVFLLLHVNSVTSMNISGYVI